MKRLQYDLPPVRSSLMASSFAAALSILQAAAITLWPLPLKSLVDDVLLPYGLGKEQTNLLSIPLLGELGSLPISTAIGGAFIVMLLLVLMRGAWGFLAASLVDRIFSANAEIMRDSLLTRLLSSREAFFESYKANELVDVITNDTTALASARACAFLALFRDLPTIFFSLALLLSLDTRLVVIAIAALTLFYALASSRKRQLKSLEKNLLSERVGFRRSTLQVLSALFSIKSLAIEPAALANLHLHNHRMSETAQTTHRARHLSRTALETVVLLLLTAGTLIVAAAYLQGRATAGGLVLSLALLLTLRRPVEELAAFAIEFEAANSSLRRLKSLERELRFEAETEGTQNISSLPFPDAVSLHFEDVSFAHQPGPMILRGFSADFHAGELIALVGPSGVGKSTFSRLMNRMLDPIHGQILLGRTDLRRFRLHLLRHSVTFVHREPYFVPGTIRSNLLLAAGEAEVDQQKISEALRAADASAFVGSLPDRLETVIGPGGLKLSDEQAKKLHLARAFLRSESRVFIFDSPTSDLDTDAAETVIESIRELADSGAIVFLTTRASSEIRLADRVVYFRSGENPLIGTHDELAEKIESYRKKFGPASSVGPEPNPPPRPSRRPPPEALI